MKRILVCLLAFALIACPAYARAQDGLRIVMPMRTNGLVDAEACEYAERLLNARGFDIEFEVSTLPLDDYISDIEYRAGERCVFILDDTLVKLMEERGAARALFGTDSLDEYLVPTSFSDYDVERVAVLMRKEYYDMYSVEVRDADGLTSLIEQIISDGFEGAPCAASPMLYDRMYIRNGYLALSLFMPMYGYYSLKQAAGSVTPLDLWARFDDTEIYSMYSLPEARLAVSSFINLVIDGYVHLYIMSARPADLSAYPLLIADTKDFSDSLMLANNKSLAALDMSEYMLFILYPDELPAFAVPGAPASRALVPDDCRDEFEHFMSWLNEYDNYIYFMYGEEGVDYEYVSGAPVRLDTDLSYWQWEQRAFFVQGEFDATFRARSLPANYISEFDSLDYPDMPLPGGDVLSTINDVVTDPDRIRLSQAMFAFRNSLESLARLKVADMDVIEAMFETPEAAFADDLISYVLGGAE